MNKKIFLIFDLKKMIDGNFNSEFLYFNYYIYYLSLGLLRALLKNILIIY